jgi:glycosyltransferase involved in cell wall biosynthesis
MVEKGARDGAFKVYMLKKLQQPGVFEHGRVGHKQLAKEFAKSGVYAYPSHFEEISCISAMKAQAGGAVPVTTDYAALKETVKYGTKVEGKGNNFPTLEVFKTALIDMLQDTTRQESIRKEMLDNRSIWGWDKVAKKWAEELFV